MQTETKAKHTPGRTQNRDDRDGRYTFDGDMSRLCVCGHTLGDHAGGAPHECFVSTKTGNTNAPDYAPCDCSKFRPSRKRAAIAKAEG